MITTCKVSIRLHQYVSSFDSNILRLIHSPKVLSDLVICVYIDGVSLLRGWRIITLSCLLYGSTFLLFSSIFRSLVMGE